METRSVGIVGTGPAGLMAGTIAVRAGLRVTFYEKRKGPARKLLIAGSSGLNIAYESEPRALVDFYTGPKDRLGPLLEAFPPEAWREFIHSLGIRTFMGTSRRWFVEGMKASGLVRAWTRMLAEAGAEFRFGTECVDFKSEQGEVLLRFANGETCRHSAMCFALGGGSYVPEERPLRWPSMFKSKGLRFTELAASNVGYQVEWPEAFVAEAEGQPIKNVVLRSSRGRRAGDVVVTKYGLEGTPVYFAGIAGEVELDLKPDLTERQLVERMSAPGENFSPMRRVKKFLGLSPAAQALVFHLAPPESRNDIEALTRVIKAFPITLGSPQPIDEAISTSGGLSFEEVDLKLMLKKHPGVFVAGEMLDWDAPTGGFLIHACVAMGYRVGRAMGR